MDISGGKWREEESVSLSNRNTFSPYILDNFDKLCIHFKRF